jgi:hypothetical protein
LPRTPLETDTRRDVASEGRRVGLVKSNATSQSSDDRSIVNSTDQASDDGSIVQILRYPSRETTSTDGDRWRSGQRDFTSFRRSQQPCPCVSEQDRTSNDGKISDRSWDGNWNADTCRVGRSGVDSCCQCRCRVRSTAVASSGVHVPSADGRLQTSIFGAVDNFRCRELVVES